MMPMMMRKQGKKGMLLFENEGCGNNGSFGFLVDFSVDALVECLVYI